MKSCFSGRCARRCGNAILPDVASGSGKPAGVEKRPVVWKATACVIWTTGYKINKLMYTRLLKGEDITLFSPSDVPGLYDAFFADQEEFERLYTKYEKDDSIRKQRVKAVELFSLMMQERASTGRIYIQNVDHCNTHSPFDPAIAPVRQSNLCLEIALPTKPLNDVDDENGEIALCTLSAFNLGAINNLDELEELAILAVRALDALLDYQDYPIPAAKRGAMGRRTLGIGV
ncbi:hypothetical protein ACLB1N_14175 [Escherichia coli]